MGKQKNTVTVVIPTLNRPNDLCQAVQSIMKQTFIPDELIVVDQSQKDDSRIMVDKFLQNHVLTERLVYIHDASVSGLVDAKKVAVEHSQGDIVMFLEDDVVLDSSYIEVLEKGFIEHPEMMGSCGVVQAVAGSGAFYTALFHFFHRGIFHDPRVGIHGNEGAVNQGLVRSNYLSGGLSAYRREVFERVPFDILNGFFALEDIDFSMRAAREFRDCGFYINTGAVLDHRMSPLNRAKLFPRYERKLREYICFYKKHRNVRLAQLNLLWLITGLLTEALVFSVKFRSFDPLTGTVSGIINGIRHKIVGHQ